MILLDAPQGPAERRNFVHKRIIGAIGGGLTGGIGGAIGGFLGGGKPGRVSPPVTAFPRFRPGTSLVPVLPPGVPQGFAPVRQGQPCPPGAFKLPTGQCFAPGDAFPGGAPMLFQSDEFGQAVIGRYGTALEPAQRPAAVRLRCPRGSVLGTDNLCYNKRDLRKGERKWPPGRKPLLTGGELNCITTARKAGRRLATKVNQLQEMGMLPKAKAPRRRKKAPAAPTVIAVSAD